MYKLKRSISWLLALVILISVSPHIQATNIDNISVNDAEYYYTDEYSIVVGVYDNGNLDIAHRDAETNTVAQAVYTVSELFDDTRSFTTDSGAVFEAVCDLVANNELALTPVSGEITHETDAPSVASSSSDINKIYDALENRYGSEYVKTTIATYSYQGYYGTLYKSMTFGANKDLSRSAVAGLTKAAVMALFGLKEQAIMEIATFIWDNTVGAYVLKSSMYAYYAKVYYTKNIGVEGIYPYSCYYTISLDAFVGDLSATLTQTGTKTTGEYNLSNRDLVKLGIENYINLYA